MAVFVTISEGTDSAEARALLVVDDPKVARDVATIIARRLGVSVGVPATRSAPRPLRPVRRPGEPEGGPP
jgi:hypothetical protein